MEFTKFVSRLRSLCLTFILTQCTSYITADMTQPLTQEQLSSFLAVLMEKCTAQKVGMLEASTAMTESRKCFERIRPGSLPTVSSSDAVWTEFKQTYAKDACNLWGKLYECYKPPVQLIERCLENQGFITNILENTHSILCVNQDEQKLSTLALQGVQSWSTCKLPSGEAFSETLRPCVGKYLDDNSNGENVNLLCRDEDYYELWKCTTEKLFQGCEDDTLGPNFYNFFSHPELKTFYQLTFGCGLSEGVRDEL